MTNLKSKKLLVVVESPNKVSAVSKILRSLGYEHVTVLASVGHTTQIKDKKDSFKNTGIYPDDNFRVEWEVAPDKQKVVNSIKTAAKEADYVLIASDPDREGESLGNHIKNLLKLSDKKYYRIKYHSITKEAIKEALEHPEKMDTALCDAAESRQVVDKLIGYSLSPVARAYLGARSVGRCQSIGLKLVVDREKEIQNFVPEYYYDLFLHFKKNDTEFKAKYIGTIDKSVKKIPSHDTLMSIINGCRHADFTIVEVVEKTKLEQPKLPFCTATFQQEASTRLGLKIKDAMSCAQKLFEGLTINGEHRGLISYMRTDSTEFAEDFITQLESYITDAFGEDKYAKPREGKKQAGAQEGHEAIRVTDPTITPEILATYMSNDLLVKVYKLIWQRTVAAGLKPAKISETTYTIKNAEHLFSMVSNELVEPGYRSIYSVTDTVEETIRESFMKDEVLVDTELHEVAKQTAPPARFTEATLVKELQRRETGRPSTYATIVETVLSTTRNYCTLEDKQIVPTEMGIQLSNYLDRAFPNIINLDYTKNMETNLDAIASGMLEKDAFLARFFNDLTEALENNQENVDTAMQLGEAPKCPNCGSTMVIRRSKFGKLFYGCPKYPDCRGIIGIN